jgi:hypothetical protein
LKITGESLKRLHGLLAQISPDGNDMKPRSNVDAGCTVVNDRQPRRLAFVTGHAHLLWVEHAGRGTRIKSLS